MKMCTRFSFSLPVPFYVFNFFHSVIAVVQYEIITIEIRNRSTDCYPSVSVFSPFSYIDYIITALRIVFKSFTGPAAVRIGTPSGAWAQQLRGSRCLLVAARLLFSDAIKIITSSASILLRARCKRPRARSPRKFCGQTITGKTRRDPNETGGAGAGKSLCIVYTHVYTHILRTPYAHF